MPGSGTAAASFTPSYVLHIEEHLSDVMRLCSLSCPAEV
jgi:hypothetical protein